MDSGSTASLISMGCTGSPRLVSCDFRHNDYATFWSILLEHYHGQLRTNFRGWRKSLYLATGRRFSVIWQSISKTLTYFTQDGLCYLSMEASALWAHYCGDSLGLLGCCGVAGGYLQDYKHVSCRYIRTKRRMVLWCDSLSFFRPKDLKRFLC